MNFLKKIPAFTLTEMLVVMVITAIVAGLAFTIISLFGKNIQIIQKNYNQSTEFHLLEEQITVDFNRFHSISYNNTNGELSFKTPIDSVLYKLRGNTIIRNGDTLFLQKHEIKLYFFGREIVNGDIDAIKVLFPDNKIDSILFVYKKNDMLQKIEQNGD